jgi:hypothetical protein
MFNNIGPGHSSVTLMRHKGMRMAYAIPGTSDRHENAEFLLLLTPPVADGSISPCVHLFAIPSNVPGPESATGMPKSDRDIAGTAHCLPRQHGVANSRGMTAYSSPAVGVALKVH